jgi:hypothetical protein
MSFESEEGACANCVRKGIDVPRSTSGEADFRKNWEGLSTGPRSNQRLDGSERFHLFVGHPIKIKTVPLGQPVAS